jgi:hypothetical protein
MRHLAGLVVLLVLAGIAFTVIRSLWMTQRRQRRAARRGMRINIPGDGSSEKPTDLKED